MSSRGSHRSDSGKGSGPHQLYDETNAEVNASLVMEGFSNLRGEVATMSKLRHPCIIHLIGISIQHLCFAMELAPLGDLASLLRRETEALRAEFTVMGKNYRTILDRVLTFKIAMQIARGVAYLHSKRIIYSDLKTDNVLLYSKDVEASVNIKLTDYGIARSMTLQGARGQAGPAGFCAPEILRGRTFTEKVDWFSYGMLVYHLISGAWPYDDLKSAVDVRNAVNVGIKPGFHFQDYTIVPLFPNLERLMKKCWQDNPLDRPNGEGITKMMQHSSYMCLKNIIPLEMDEITCIHPGTSKTSYVDMEMQTVAKDTGQNGEDRCQAKREEMQYHSPRDSMQDNQNLEPLCLWTSEGASRQCTKTHIRISEGGERFPKSIVGPRVNCMVQVGLWELVGTQDNTIQLFGPPNIGPQYIVHQHDFQLDAEVLCLCYQPIEDETTQGRLFAGLADGHLVIFNHFRRDRSNPDLSTAETCWHKIKTLAFENKRCSHLELVAERKELWIACGNKLRVLRTEIMLLDADITVTPRAEHKILGLAHHHDNLFCIIDQSSRVFQFSMVRRHLVQVLQCGKFEMEKGVSLIAEDDDDGIEEFDFQNNVEEPAEDTRTSPTSDSSEDEEISFRDSYFSASTPQMQSATLPAPLKSSISASYRHSRNSKEDAEYHRPFSEGADRRRSSLSIPAVQSILAIKDTLWIGTTHGKIVVICVDSNNRHKFHFGEVLAIMEVFLEKEEKEEPIRQLMRVGEDHVVAWHELKMASLGSSVLDTREAKPHQCQLLVWQAWGSEEVAKFDHIHQMMNEAEENMSN